MADTLVSVKKAGNAAGRSKGKKHYIYLFLWEDVAEFTKDDDNITVTDFSFKEGKKPMDIFIM